MITKFNQYYKNLNHTKIQGTSLIPPIEDESTLFTTSGMHPLTPFLMGKPHPQGTRLFNNQRCLRTTDLDEVGDSTHLTVFTMLGTWSLGDYDHIQSVDWGLELLIDCFGLPRTHLYCTRYQGDDQVPKDERLETICQKWGVPLVDLGREDNWWSNGPTGPCGPDSEIFFFQGDHPEGNPGTDSRWIEIVNHVSMKYNNQNGVLLPLKQVNVDTGMGYERLMQIVESKSSVYETSLFEPWKDIQTQFDLNQKDWRMVSDHLRSSLVCISDGVMPSNTGRGYVLRKLLRRSFNHVDVLDLPKYLVEHTQEVFGLDNKVDFDVLVSEQIKYQKLLQRGTKLIEKKYRTPSPEDYHFLFDTHGIPREVVDRIIEQFD